LAHRVTTNVKAVTQHANYLSDIMDRPPPIGSRRSGVHCGEAGGGRGLGQTLILKRASASPHRRGAGALTRASSCNLDDEACAATTRSVDHLFRGGASNLVVWACGYGAILRYCRVRWAATRHLTVTRHPRAGHLIRVHGLASLEVTRATHPDSLLITQSVPIPRKSAVRVSERQ
jgi:hypothetical protein